MEWTARHRQWHEDFEDFTDREHNHSSGLVMWMLPEPLLNGEDLDSEPFLQWAIEAWDKDEDQMADHYLRLAANRGNWYAMVCLAEDRAERFEFDEESWRWASRVVFFLEDERNEFIDYLGRETRDDVIANARHMMAICVKNNPAADQTPPNDVGAGAEQKYCLRHGRPVYRDTPVGTCDDSAHLVLRGF
jgi:hypothetical protein